MGAKLRVFGPMTGFSTNLVMGVAAGSWSGAYLLFAMVYGPFLLRPSLDEYPARRHYLDGVFDRLSLLFLCASESICLRALSWSVNSAMRLSRLRIR